MKKNSSAPDEYPEVTAADMARATYRVGTKTATKEEWHAAVTERTGRKQRINIMLDAQIVAWFKAQAGDRGYQTLINETLKQAISQNDLESTLRRIIREELKQAA